MPLAMKACWVVVAGIIPEEPEGEWTRQWSYTSKDYEDDRGKDVADMIYTRYCNEANDYARSLMMQPHALNWVQVQWFWI